MSIKKLSPMRPALSTGEIRAHLRNFDTQEVGLIESYLLASQQDIEIQCERSIVAAKYRLTLPSFPCASAGLVRSVPFQERMYGNTSERSRDITTDGSAILLNMVPTLKIASIQYYDADNVSQSYLDWNLFSDNEPAELRQDLDTSWPSTYTRRDAVTLQFWAGHIVPLTLNAETDTFTSVTGYPFVNGDEITISTSGNSNPDIGDVAVLPTGISARTTYYVRDVSGSSFKIASSSGGSALSLAEPTADGEAIDLLFAYEIDPWHKLALLQMTAKAFGERCPQGGCVCSKEDFEINPVLRRMIWRSPVEFI